MQFDLGKLMFYIRHPSHPKEDEPMHFEPPKRGPKTPEGKAIVSQNGLKHGLLSKHVVIRNENPVEFQRLLTSLRRQYKPRGPGEHGAVTRIAAGYWRLNRLYKACAATMEKVYDEVLPTGDGLPTETRQDRALIASVNNPWVGDLEDKARAVERDIDRAFDELRYLQAARALSFPVPRGSLRLSVQLDK